MPVEYGNFDRLPGVMNGERIRWLHDVEGVDQLVGVGDHGRPVLQARSWPEFTWRRHPKTWATSKEMCAQ